MGFNDSHDLLSGCNHVKRWGHRGIVLHTSLVIAELNSVNHIDVRVSQETVFLACISSTARRTNTWENICVLMVISYVALTIYLLLLVLLLLVTKDLSMNFWHISCKTIAHVMKRFKLLLVHLIGG